MQSDLEIEDAAVELEIEQLLEDNP